MKSVFQPGGISLCRDVMPVFSHFEAGVDTNVLA